MPRRKTTTKTTATKPKKRAVKKKPIKKKENTDRVIKNKELTIEAETKIEREKIIAMWAGVIFFMIIIFSFWAVSFKNSVKSVIKETPEAGVGLSEAINNFNSSLNETKNSFSDFQEALENNSDIKEESITTENQIQELEQRLKEMEEKIKLEKFLYKFNDELDENNKTE